MWDKSFDSTVTLSIPAAAVECGWADTSGFLLADRTISGYIT